MFLSNSMVVVEVNDVLNFDSDLKDITFLDGEQFYAMNFFDNTNNEFGEIQWSNSYQFGKMNTINFIRENKYFYLFTSSIQNYKYLETILKKLVGEDISVTLFRLPLNCKYGNTRTEVDSIEIDPYFGIKASLNISENPIMLKIYTNGLITYPTLNDQAIVMKIIEISTDIIKKCLQDD